MFLTKYCTHKLARVWRFEVPKRAKTRFCWVMQNYYKNTRVEISKQIKKHKELGSIQKSKHMSNKTKTVQTKPGSFKVIEMLILG